MGLYTRFRALWQDGSAGGTPLTAAALNYIEDGIVAASDHGTLAGLGDDDHAQYLLRTDASAAYATKAELLGSSSLAGSFVAAEESTTSSSYGALPTAQSQAFTAGPRGLLEVSLTAAVKSSVATSEAHMSFEITGAAGAVAPSDIRALMSTSTTYQRFTTGVRVTGLTPGAQGTITARFRASAGTATFKNRDLGILGL